VCPSDSTPYFIFGSVNPFRSTGTAGLFSSLADSWLCSDLAKVSYSRGLLSPADSVMSSASTRAHLCVPRLPSSQALQWMPAARAAARCVIVPLASLWLAVSRRCSSRSSLRSAPLSPGQLLPAPLSEALRYTMLHVDASRRSSTGLDDAIFLSRRDDIFCDVCRLISSSELSLMPLYPSEAYYRSLKGSYKR